MEDTILKVQNLGDCSREEAIDLLQKASGDPIEALCLKMGVIEEKRALSKEQEFFKRIRNDMEKLEHGIHSGFKKDQSESLEQDEMQTHLEEMVQQNNYYQECQIPSQE